MKQLKNFFIDCMLFRSKEKLHTYLGIYCWLSVFMMAFSICMLVVNN